VIGVAGTDAHCLVVNLLTDFPPHHAPAPPRDDEARLASMARAVDGAPRCRKRQAMGRGRNRAGGMPPSDRPIAVSKRPPRLRMLLARRQPRTDFLGRCSIAERRGCSTIRLGRWTYAHGLLSGYTLVPGDDDQRLAA
jgi:hypothetical protein